MKASFLCLLLAIFFLVLAGCQPAPVPDPADLEISEEKAGNWETIEVAPGFLLTNNMWGTEKETTQVIFQYANGSYGWSWERGKTRENGNYPEVIFGVKPWGQERFIEEGELPLRLNGIDSLVMEMDLDYEVLHDTGDNAWWNLAFEVWLTEKKPGGNVEDSITDEIMIWFDWKDVPWDPEEEEWEDPKAVVDDDGDGSYEYAYCLSEPNWGEWGWHYHQFRIKEKGTIPTKVNIKPFLDYVQKEHQRSGELWLGSLELGMEYGDNTAGRVHIKSLNYVINGVPVKSGK